MAAPLRMLPKEVSVLNFESTRTWRCQLLTATTFVELQQVACCKTIVAGGLAQSLRLAALSQARLWACT